MQSLSSVMGNVTAKIKTAEVAKAESEKKEKTFHQKELARKDADPNNSNFKGARALGLARAKDFLTAAVSPHRPDHEDAFKIFKEKYDMNAGAVDEDFVDHACAELEAYPPEIADPAYEATLMRKYKPQGDVEPAKQKFYENFCDALRQKWNRVGYRGDRDFVQAYSDKYNLKPNERLQELIDFQPKK